MTPIAQPTTPRLRVLSLGAGVQSTTLLLMALRGEIERPDCAIFADTGWEPRAVYEHLGWLEREASKGGVPIHRVSAGNLKQDLLDAAAGRKPRVSNPPFFVKNRPNSEYSTPDRGGMLWRKCTKTYKVEVIRKKVRALAEAAHGSKGLPQGFVQQWFGISFEELQRMRDSDVAYIVNRYPLVDRRMTRQDCIAWLTRHGYTIPPKSACLGCPYHSDATWRELKRRNPEEWEDTVAFDRAIRRGLPGVKGEAYLHRSMIPLDLVDLRYEERGSCRCSGKNAAGTAACEARHRLLTACRRIHGGIVSLLPRMRLSSMSIAACTRAGREFQRCQQPTLRRQHPRAMT